MGEKIPVLWGKAPATRPQVLITTLKTCGRTRNLEMGKQVHGEAVECGYDCNIYVTNAIINMYAKCGSMVDAREVFDCAKHPDVVSSNILISGYANNGQGQTALDMFSKMNIEGPAPNSVTMVAALKACTSLALKEGASRCRDRAKKIHSLALCTCNSDVYVQNTLVDLFAKCSSMVDALAVFEGMKHPDVVSWNALISGYADNGQGQIALDMFTKMRTEGHSPDSVTFLAVIKACTSLAVKRAGQWVRDKAKIIRVIAVEGCNSEVCVQNALVDIYAKSGSMVDAREIFDGIKRPDVVSWNALLSGYAVNGQDHTTLCLFTRMRTEGPAPNSVTLVSALKACASLTVKEGAQCKSRGKALHSLAVQNGCESDVHVQGTLVDMYSKSGSMLDACEVFHGMKHPDVVSWNVLVWGYAHNGQGHTALEFFVRMRTEGPDPNSVTLVAALKACTSVAHLNRGKGIHNFAVESGCDSDLYVQNTLIDMYAKCGCTVGAREVFDSTKHTDVVSWTALILGYADNGQSHIALEVFTRMRSEGRAPNYLTYRAVLKACSLVGALDFGRTIHTELDDKADIDVVLVACLVDFYVKCGSLVEAQSVFDMHAETRDILTWNALLAGFSSCPDKESVFGLFKAMQDDGFKPDGITFLRILTYCSHAGLVGEGEECFNSMITKHGIVPTVEHYNCMIDLLGRLNRLDDAMDLLECMPCSPNDVTWMIMLSACRKWKNVELGRLAFSSLTEPNHSAYVLMGQILGSKGMVQEQMLVDLRSHCKKGGESFWTNEVGDVHTFFAKDNHHPRIHQIRDKWESMCVVMRQHGYTLNMLSATSRISEEALCGHSERLALVCALINTDPGKTVSIVKNQRVCDDCHIAIALISKLELRTIICKDASRIHCFKDGNCSCGDFW